MAVENLTLTSRGNNSIPSGHGEANKVTTMCFTVEVTAAATDASTYSAPFGIPHDARMLGGRVYWDDLASSGSPTLDFGLKSGTKTVTADPDALSNGHDAATINHAGRCIVKPANYGKKAWELAGESSDPGQGTYTVYVSLVDADVNVGGNLVVEVEYTLD